MTKHMKLPGTRSLAVARLLVNPVAVTQVLEPLVADWQREWLASGTSMRRAMIRVRGCVAFVCASAYCCAMDPMPGDVRRRAWIILSTFVALGTFVPAVLWTVRVPRDLIVYWMPSTLALSIAFATLPLAIVLGRPASRSGSHVTLGCPSSVPGMFRAKQQCGYHWRCGRPQAYS